MHAECLLHRRRSSAILANRNSIAWTRRMPPSRQMSLTPELVSLCYRKEENLGFHDDWIPLTEAEHDAVTQRLLDECGEGPLWLFAYGSLIWNPTFEVVETRRATAIGWHRSFCMEMTSWRGTREIPGLMMALDRGGRCDGVALARRCAGRSSSGASSTWCAG
jgi:glutathione-specific gamma-glutamylcyclotransferase